MTNRTLSKWFLIAAFVSSDRYWCGQSIGFFLCFFLLLSPGISSCPPKEYAERFERRVAAQIIESYDRHNPEAQSPAQVLISA